MMDAERFYGAATFESYVAAARKYPELWSISHKRATVPAEILAPLEELARPLHLAVITEDWCIDAIGSVPYV
ncbi:MAG TPA: thioredoxin family protein, partial [Candidatus Elarobacter sp.]|nr:thioredoxin family protein [Candidatus Elarobacter sp.]